MTKTLRIVVTAKDIKMGKPASRGRCAVELAFSRAIKDPVAICGFELNSYKMASGVRLPDRMVGFVREFDIGLEVKPTSFTIEYVAAPSK